MKTRNNLWKYPVALAVICFILAISCKKENVEKTITHQTGTLTDVDGNVYKTVKIGNQWWMSEDLKVSRYSNGTSLLKVQSDNQQWQNDTAGAFCDIKDNTQTTIGEFYNWYAVNNTNNLAPAGWHIPTDNDWKELEEYLGMKKVDADNENWRGTHEAEKLKIEAPNGWTRYGEIWGTNESGFTALARGCRLYDGTPGDPGLFATGFWWSSTPHSENHAWYRYLDYKNPNVYRAFCLKSYGFSVRCVKD